MPLRECQNCINQLQNSYQNYGQPPSGGQMPQLGQRGRGMPAMRGAPPSNTGNRGSYNQLNQSKFGNQQYNQYQGNLRINRST